MGIEEAGFEHIALFENDAASCNTLRLNRPEWNVVEHDLFEPYDYSKFKGVDLLAGGLPCPPFSVAGKKLGEADERNLFGIGIELVDTIRPNAVMYENVRGLMAPQFAEYRESIEVKLHKLNYHCRWIEVQASDFGVPQLRPRVVLVAVRQPYDAAFDLDDQMRVPKTVGECLHDLMSSNGWIGAERWRTHANTIAPTIVGGSKKHGGPDLGPTRARQAWAALGVDGKGIADSEPLREFVGMPRLTTRMVARIQGFDDDWGFWGGKTAQYRQVGNAFPPPVARAVGVKIADALHARRVRSLKAAG